MLEASAGPLASMGPQLDSCGRLAKYEKALAEHKKASMGPQLDSCGRGDFLKVTGVVAASLQWGRNLTVAEGISTRSPASSAASCFNGAAT